MAISKIEQNSLGSVSITTAQISNASVTPAKLSQPLTSGTAVASTSGTSIDFTGIPSWVKRITVMFAGVSINASSDIIIRLGSGSVQTSGYLVSSFAISNDSVAYTNAYTSGFGLRAQSGNNDIHNANLIFNLLDTATHRWVGSGSDNLSNNARVLHTVGSVTLTGVLDRVRITTVNGTDTFDAGSINILYE